MLDHIVVGFLPSFRGHEILAARGLEDSSTSLDRVGHRR